jgi:two-component system response regulator AlgR
VKILIVDDELPARERLKDLIRDGAGEQHQLLEAETGLEALNITHAQKPDAVLLDIRMPGMDGLETAYHLAHLETPPAVIFTTAYDEHALDAFEMHAVDYLLKPIRRERLQEALPRAQIISKARITAVRNTEHGNQPRTHLSAVVPGGLRLIPVAEIQFLKADQKYVRVGWSGEETLIDDSLKALEEEFPGRFLRVHRSTLVAPAQVLSLVRGEDGLSHIRLRGVRETLPVSRRHLGEVRRVIRRFGAQVQDE